MPSRIASRKQRQSEHSPARQQIQKSESSCTANHNGSTEKLGRAFVHRCNSAGQGIVSASARTTADEFCGYLSSELQQRQFRACEELSIEIDVLENANHFG